MIFRCFPKSSAPSRVGHRLCLLLALALLIPVVAVVAQETAAERKIGEDTTKVDRPVQKMFTGLFENLRLKPKQEAEKKVSTAPSRTATLPAKPTTPKSTDAANSPPNVGTTASARPATPVAEKAVTAPLPPEGQLYGKIAQNSAAKSKVTDPFLSQVTSATPLATAPAAIQPDSIAPPQQEQVPAQPEEPTVASLSSYSFDTRDWVEYYPVENSIENDETARAVERNVEASVRAPDGWDEWSGSATPLPTMRQTRQGASHLASAKHVDPESDKAGPAKAEEDKNKKIDLTASHGKRLPYSDVCGVVVVQSDFPLTSIQSILEEIKLLQRDLNLYMGVPAPEEKIELCLFRDESSYLKFLREVFPNAPRDRRALYIKLDGKPGTLLVQRTEEFEVDLRHEMTHAIIHASIRDVPIWLDEGLAKYFEVPIKDRAENNPYMKQIRWNTKFGAVPLLSRLEKLEHIGQMENREYRDSWAWVHFMIHHSPQTHRLLAGYLQLLAELEQSPPSKENNATVRIPLLSHYLNDELDFPRDSYREHFQTMDD